MSHFHCIADISLYASSQHNRQQTALNRRQSDRKLLRKSGLDRLSGDKSHQYVQCDEKISDITDLQNHSLTHVVQKLFHCQECGLSFDVFSNLQAHMTEHADNRNAAEKPYSCEQCSKRFLLPDGLLQHVETAHCIKPYSRGKWFVKSYGHKYRPSQCDHCGKILSSRSNWLKHIRIHSTDALHFMCEECGKTFRHQRNLRRHVRTHTGEKHYMCHVCEKGFLQASGLRLHMVVHTGETRFQCHLCPKRFSRSDHLKVHIKRHKGIFCIL